MSKLSIITQRVSGSINIGGPSVSGAYNVDPNNTTGNAGGNGILVGETGQGNGSSSGVSGTGPWTLAQFHTALSNGSLAPGDVVECMNGNYAPTSTVIVVGGGNTDLGGGDANIANVIWIRAKPGHNSVLISYDSSYGLGVDDAQLSPPFSLRAGNMRWEGFQVENEMFCWTTDVGYTCPRLEWVNIRRSWLGNKTAGDNSGVIMVQNNANNWLIRGFVTVAGQGENRANANASEIYWIANDGGVLEYSLLESGTGSSSGHLLHHKRNSTNITIRKNLFYHRGGSAVFKAVATQQHNIEDNIFVGDGWYTPIEWSDDGANNNPTGYQCSIVRNIATKLDGISGAPYVRFGVARQYGGNSENQGTDSVLRRNIVDGTLTVGFLGTIGTAYSHLTDCDENWARDTGVMAREFSDYTSWASWLANTTYFLNGTHDQASVSDDMSWNTRSARVATSFTCTNTPTINGSAPGPADLSDVGPAALGLST